MSKQNDSITMDIENFQNGNTLIGYYAGSANKASYYAYPHFIFLDPESPGYQFIIPMKAALKKPLSTVRVGQLVKIVKGNDIKVGKYNKQTFQVFKGGMLPMHMGMEGEDYV